jgi:kynureninase
LLFRLQQMREGFRTRGTRWSTQKNGLIDGANQGWSNIPQRVANRLLKDARQKRHVLTAALSANSCGMLATATRNRANVTEMRGFFPDLS